MASLWDLILAQNWLYGSFLSLGGASLASLGFLCQKAAQYKATTVATGTSKVSSRLKNGAYEEASWGQLRWRPLFWLGVVLYAAHTPVSMWAQSYAPQTTVLPLGGIQVWLNLVFAYAILHEVYRAADIYGSTVCILGTAAMNLSMPSNIAGHMQDFPYLEALHFCEGLTSNAGFGAYLLVWIALFGVCIVLVHTIQEAKPLAFPILIGLLTSQFNFMVQIATTLVFQGAQKDSLIWENRMTYVVMISAVVLYVMSIYVTCEGLRCLAARFFSPATFVSIYAFTAIEGLLFFREWEHMTNVDIIIFTISCLTTVAAVTFISPAHTLIPHPSQSFLNSPLLKTTPMERHRMVLEIMEEHGLKKCQSTAACKDLEVFDMSVPFKGTYRWFPIVTLIAIVACPWLLYSLDCVFSALVYLTIYGLYNGWNLGLHCAIYAYVGTKKIAHYDNADFQELYEAEQKVTKAEPLTPKWEDVVHFVILPNYKEDLEILRLAIRSIARSNIALTQICLLLAMEEREEGSRGKADILRREFESSFRCCLATYHPPDLPGDVPGKSANTRWAACRVMEEFLPSLGLRITDCVLTVADADSEFHHEYFAALTYHFIVAGAPAGETPIRFLTIWQPPIVHFKNYYTQPILVRWASFLPTCHELGNLSSPRAVRLVYSSYSISAALAKAVHGWDPDWISEDWHMFLKCFFATGGQARIFPIFLPLLNYAPEDDSCSKTLVARWVQAKRHALGFAELVYFNEQFPRILHSLQSWQDRVMFSYKAFFLWVKMLMIHVTMGTLCLVGPLNGLLIVWFLHHGRPQDLNINSWTFLINCVSQAGTLVSTTCTLLVSVEVYYSIRHRVDGFDDPNLSIRWRWKPLHLTLILLESPWLFPVMLCFASLAEWLAAIKCARTHKFHYEVAVKPTLVAADSGTNDNVGIKDEATP